MDNKDVIGEPTADDLIVDWVGQLVHSDTLCAHCFGPTQRGAYVLVDRRTGDQVSDPINGLRCAKCGDLNTDGFLLKPLQID